jgi:hypothetical protein
LTISSGTLSVAVDALPGQMQVAAAKTSNNRFTGDLEYTRKSMFGSSLASMQPVRNLSQYGIVAQSNFS